MHHSAGTCIVCARPVGRAVQCPWCGETNSRGIRAAPGLILCAIAVLLAILAPVVQNYSANGILAGVPWRDAFDSATRSARPSLFPGSGALFLSAAAILAAALAALCPALHLYAWLGILLAAGVSRIGTSADWFIALAAGLGADAILHPSDPGTSCADPNSGPLAPSETSAPKARIPDSRKRFTGISASLAELTLAAGCAPLLFPFLRRLTLFLHPHLYWIFALTCLALILRPRPGPHWLSKDIRRQTNLRDLLFAACAAAGFGALGLGGGVLAVNSGYPGWSPFPLALSAGAFRLTGLRGGKMKPFREPETADQRPAFHFKDALLGAGAGLAALSVPIATLAPASMPFVTRSDAHATVRRVIRPVFLAGGFLVAASYANRLPFGGGAWLAEAAGIRPSRSFVLPGLLAFFCGTLAGAMLTPLTCRIRRRLNLRYASAALLFTALLTLNLPGAIFLAACFCASQAGKELDTDPKLFIVAFLLPVALRFQGVASPWPM